MGAPTDPLRFTVLTSRVPARLGKRLCLGEDGSIEKSANAVMVDGHAHVESVRTLGDLQERLDRLSPNQAIAWGVPVGGDARVVPKRELAQHPGAIARSTEYFAFPDDGPGIMMLDHDATPSGWPELSADDLHAILGAACPALVDAPMLVRPSSSSGVQTIDGAQRMPRRLRGLIPVSRAADIPEAGERLVELLWALGLGWCDVSESGAVLYRTLIDATVWGAWKYDLAAPPELGEGLIRVPAPPKTYGDPVARFDLSRICISDEQRTAAQAHRRREAEAVAPRAAVALAAYIERRAPEIVRRRGGTVDDARRALSAASKRELLGDSLVTLSSGDDVTVTELLADPTKYDKAKMYDPLEPGDDPRIATAFLGGPTQNIYSHAHGGITYRLVRDATSVGFGLGVTLPAGASLTPPQAPAPGDPHPPKNNGIASEDPLSTARTLVEKRFSHADGARFKTWQESSYRWESSRWLEMRPPDVRAELYDFLDRHGRPFGYGPTQPGVNKLLDALRAATHLDSTLQPPCWIAGASLAPAAELVPCANGMLHLPSRTLIAPTPRFFNLGAVPFNFDPLAPAPEQWLRFLATVWPDDSEAIATLQELFGYLLTPDTSQQKIFLIVGPKRSGKGTIARVLTEMLGPENVAGPTLASMATPFGLQPLVGTLAAIISDARLSGRTDQKEVAENLLRISGEDRIEIGRKFLPSLTMRLATRFVILTNELPRIADASGAMASRFVILTMRESFIGREDPGLTSRLLTELPGILAWAVEGWHRLRARGYFVEPKSSAGAAQELADLGSPIGAFVRDECECALDAEIEMGKMFTHWRDWCVRQGITYPGSAQTFGRDLRAAFPSISQARPRTAGERVRLYRGVRLRGPHGPRATPLLFPTPPTTSAIAQQITDDEIRNTKVRGP